MMPDTRANGLRTLRSEMDEVSKSGQMVPSTKDIGVKTKLMARVD